MKLTEVEAAIPLALTELQDTGTEHACFIEIGSQVTLHNETYLHKRQIARRFLGYIGINITELPSKFSHPAPGKIILALSELEDQGVIVSEFNEAPEHKRPIRRTYKLVNSPVELNS